MAYRANRRFSASTNGKISISAMMDGSGKVAEKPPRIKATTDNGGRIDTGVSPDYVLLITT